MTPNRRAFILALAMGLGLIPTPTWGGANPMLVEPTAPAHHFFSCHGDDVTSTHKALKVPGTREANPLAKSQGALISLKIAGTGAGLGIAYVMHRSGHYKAERVIPMIFGVPSGLAALHNSGIHR